uniref:Disease resistance protein winged helix domain-containing protein n=1 Tax=Solanum lycopersicum TaxID=4081 RepID=A0A3Q7ICF1_SOLLC
MADPVIVATIQVLLEKLLSLTIEKVRPDCNKHLRRMTQNVSIIQDFIHDAQRRQVDDEDQANVLDKFLYESLQEQVQNSPMRKLSKDLGLQSLIVPSQQIVPMIRETDFLVGSLDVVGRDNNVAEIKEKMLNMREEVVLCAIPIVGILESLTHRKLEVHTRDIIVKKFRDELGGKIYLLVLDDLWSFDLPVWDEFIDSLRGVNTSRGNCILVMTRMKLEASTVATVGLHMFEKLANDHCLPFGASVLGGLLRNKEKHEWWTILDGNPIVAEGFLHPYQETTVIEDVGHNFLQILLQNSLLQYVELEEHNNIKYYKMHDFDGDILKSKLFDSKGNDEEKLSQVGYIGWVSPSDKMDMINESGRLCTLF